MINTMANERTLFLDVDGVLNFMINDRNGEMDIYAVPDLKEKIDFLVRKLDRIVWLTCHSPSELVTADDFARFKDPYTAVVVMGGTEQIQTILGHRVGANEKIIHLDWFLNNRHKSEALSEYITKNNITDWAWCEDGVFLDTDMAFVKAHKENFFDIDPHRGLRWKDVFKIVKLLNRR